MLEMSSIKTVQQGENSCIIIRRTIKNNMQTVEMCEFLFLGVRGSGGVEGCNMHTLAGVLLISFSSRDTLVALCNCTLCISPVELQLSAQSRAGVEYFS